MKKLLLAPFLFLFIFSCVTEKKDTLKNSSKKISPISNSDLETAVIYEANIRQYSAKGTFDEFTKDIPEIKKLGVKII